MKNAITRLGDRYPFAAFAAGPVALCLALEALVFFAR